MTIDEAIKHAEKVAEDEERNAGWYYDKERSCYKKKCIKCADEHRQLAGWLKELKQLRDQTRWIPVSERLPDKEECYLVITTGTNNDIIDIAYYVEGIWHKASRIKAWMPLPKKYEPQKSEEQTE